MRTSLLLVFVLADFSWGAAVPILPPGMMFPPPPGSKLILTPVGQEKAGAVARKIGMAEVWAKAFMGYYQNASQTAQWMGEYIVPFWDIYKSRKDAFLASLSISRGSFGGSSDNCGGTGDCIPPGEGVNSDEGAYVQYYRRSGCVPSTCAQGNAIYGVSYLAYTANGSDCHITQSTSDSAPSSSAGLLGIHRIWSVCRDAGYCGASGCVFQDVYYSYYGLLNMTAPIISQAPPPDFSTLSKSTSVYNWLKAATDTDIYKTLAAGGSSPGVGIQKSIAGETPTGGIYPSPGVASSVQAGVDAISYAIGVFENGIVLEPTDYTVADSSIPLLGLPDTPAFQLPDEFKIKDGAHVIVDDVLSTVSVRIVGGMPAVNVNLSSAVLTVKMEGDTGASPGVQTSSYTRRGDISWASVWSEIQVAASSVPLTSLLSNNFLSFSSGAVTEKEFCFQTRFGEHCWDFEDYGINTVILLFRFLVMLGSVLFAYRIIFGGG